MLKYDDALAVLRTQPLQPDHPTEIAMRLEAHATVLKNYGSGERDLRAATADICRMLAETWRRRD